MTNWGQGEFGVKGEHRTLAELAAERLHEQILSGAIPAGSHLRINDLAERLGMSPMPVREAVRRLVALGLVEQHAHRGAFVREFSIADFDDTIRVRVMLERTAVEWAAARFEEKRASYANDLLDRYAKLLADGRAVEAREVHGEFHFTLYQESGSPWLVHAITPVWRNSERYRFAAGTEVVGAEALIAEHRDILTACEAREPERAGDALASHLQRAAERMAANLHAHTSSDQTP